MVVFGRAIAGMGMIIDGGILMKVGATGLCPSMNDCAGSTNCTTTS